LSGMSKGNAWANPSTTSTANVIQMAAFLEERSHSPDMQEVNQKLCEVVAPKRGERILEVGCGSGVLCRILAPCLQPDGDVIGIDISYKMAMEAGEYALSAGVIGGIDFGSAGAEALPFSDASFDCAVAARLLLHVANPALVIGEMMRVVKPGGKVVVMDWDFGTVAVDHPDRKMTRQLLHWRNDYHGGNNWSGRQLWRHMKEAGLRNVSVHPCVLIAHDESDGLTQSLWRAAQVACEAGVISEQERENWVMELKKRIQAGTFFASIVYFIVMGNVAGLRKQAI
jgi:ubiquinone/menaquinone biosynthesis C-methylase UbiE